MLGCGILITAGGGGGRGRKKVCGTGVEHAGGLGHRVFWGWDWELLD